MRELKLSLKVLIQDLDHATGELRSSVVNDNDLKFNARLSSINSTISYLRDLTSGLLEELENQNAQNAPLAPKALV